MNIFDKYSDIYDLLYKDKDYQEEVEYIQRKIKQYNNNVRDILEFGSGTGIHGSLLAEKGYNITGIEISKKMYQKGIENIEKRGVRHKFNLINNNIILYRDKKKYDLVISLFHVISYINNNDDLLKVFENSNFHLKSGGLFIFDVWYLPAVLNLKPQTKIKTYENNLLKVIRFTKPYIRFNENIVDVNFEFFVIDKKTNELNSFQEIHNMRYFSIPEIQLLAKISSFEILRVEEFLTENEPSENTWGVCFILRKK